MSGAGASIPTPGRAEKMVAGSDAFGTAVHGPVEVGIADDRLCALIYAYGVRID